MKTLLFTPARVALLLAVVPAASAQDVQQQQKQMEMILKWGMAQDVHYKVVADYSGTTRVLAAPIGGAKGMYSGAEGAVTDQFEIQFDWNPTQMALIGKPVIVNHPTSTPVLEKRCQPPKLNGPYEHVDVVGVKPLMGELVLTAERKFPPGAAPFVPLDTGDCGIEPVQAKTETLTLYLPILSGKLFATPASAGQNIRVGEGSTGKVIVGKDGKTMVLDDSGRGWKYTYTLAIVK